MHEDDLKREKVGGIPFLIFFFFAEDSIYIYIFFKSIYFFLSSCHFCFCDDAESLSLSECGGNIFQASSMFPVFFSGCLLTSGMWGRWEGGEVCVVSMISSPVL